MRLKLWSKGNKHRLYLVDAFQKDNAYIDVSTSAPLVGGGTAEQRQALTDVIDACALYNCSTLDDVIIAVELGGHTLVKSKPKSPGKSQKKAFPMFEAIDMRTPADIIKQISDSDIHKAPFKKTTIRNTKLWIDSREPESIVDAFQRSPLTTERATLPLADFKIEDTATGDVMLIERKTITDLYSSTISTHLHSQAERLYDWEHSLTNTRSRVVWIIESEQAGNRVLYNSLPHSKQVDGLINYFVGVLGQFVVQTYNSKHSAYMIHKLAQGFVEQQLPYPVKSDNGKRIDLSKRDRGAERSQRDNSQSHAVSIPGRDVMQQILCAIPGVNTRIAESFISAELSLPQILALSETELLDFAGVGKKTAAVIAKEFKALL